MKSVLLRAMRGRCAPQAACHWAGLPVLESGGEISGRPVVDENIVRTTSAAEAAAELTIQANHSMDGSHKVSQGRDVTTASDDGFQPDTTAAVRVAVVATLATIVSVMPIFLLGGLASLVRRDLGFDEAILGLVSSSFFVAAAIVSRWAGSLADRIGSSRAIPLALCASIASLFAISSLGNSWRMLVICMLVGGSGNALMQPAANLALARGVRTEYQGIAFGMKQAAIPVATLVAGLSVPMVGLTLGWRWAFGSIALLAVPLVAVSSRLQKREAIAPLPRRSAKTMEERGPSIRERSQRPEGLLAVAIAGGCGAAAANSLGAFTVESMVAAGQSIGRAGFLLSLGSVFAIVTRLAVGRSADRKPKDQFRVWAFMMVSGSFALASLGWFVTTEALIVALIIAFAAGWGWPGLMHYAVVQAHRNRPAAAIGMSQTGVYIGGIVGPASFGWLVSVAGYRLAWSVSGMVMLIGGLVLYRQRRSVRSA